MRNKIFWCVALLAVLATSCTSEEPSGTDATPQTRTVQIDGTSPKYAGTALSYFPNEVSLHAGDSVDFKQVFSGEPHSVTFGKLVDDAVPAALKLGEKEPEGDLKEKLEALPAMLPEGPGDANQAAANPCFVKGELPADATKPCPKIAQPEFDGTYDYYSSGYLAPDAAFKVKLASDLKPGAYSFYCNLHGPDMSGSIKVVGAGESIPSAAAVSDKAKEQLEKAFEPTDKAYEAAVSGKTPFPALAGFGSEESHSTGILEFIPKTIKAKVNQKVTWTFFAFHTVSFNSPAEASLVMVKAPDGTWHANEKMAAPAGGPGMPAPPAEGESSATPEATPAPSASASATGAPTASPGGGAPPAPTVVDGGKFDGTGARSSGLFMSFPPDLFAYSLTFTKAGTFNYVCLIHPAMVGTVEGRGKTGSSQKSRRGRRESAALV